MATTIIDRLANTNYVISSLQDVAQLANMVVKGGEAGTTYLKVFLTAVQADLGNPSGRRGRTGPQPSIESCLAILERVNSEYYPAVLEGVGPPELDKAERSRRATFARSATSTLRTAIKAGVDIRTVAAKDVSKGLLRRLASDAKGGGTTATVVATGASLDPLTTALRTVQRAQRMLLNALTVVEQLDPDKAVDVVEEIVTELDKIVPVQEVSGTTTVITKPAPSARERTAPGAMYHRGA